MQDELFEWDDDKAAANLAKHKIGFEEARLVFDDRGFLDEPDETMDYGEERFRATGMVNGRLISVSYTPRGDRSRIISARRATKKEQQRYVEQNPPS